MFGLRLQQRIVIFIDERMIANVASSGIYDQNQT
jgi:hypothetical protein